MRRDLLAAAFDATQAALTLADIVSLPERALIEALAARFPQREPETLDVMRGWNDAFADAMRAVHETYPEDLDIRAIFAEAVMNRTPWQMWDQATGQPMAGAGTLEAQAVLEAALDKEAVAMRHPGILHLYVHLMEMSPLPEKALKAGDALRELVPDAGHLIHMPTHIDIQCGNYRDVLHWNWKATKVDRKALDRTGVFTLYTGYRIHNYHFAVYGAMFLGQFEPAWTAARELVDVTPEALLRVPSPPFADFFESYMAIWVHVLIRFGRWRRDHRRTAARGWRTLRQPHRDAALRQGDRPCRPRRGGRGRTAKGTVPRGARPDAGESRRMHNVLCLQQLAVAEAMLDGEIEYRKGNYDRAFARLRDAVALRGCATLRRALGLDAADPPRPGRTAARTGTHRRGRSGLPRRPRPGRQL